MEANNKAMREALILARERIVETKEFYDGACDYGDLSPLLAKIDSALAAPPRACDIMTEEDLIKVVSSGIMQSITSRPKLNFDELKALLEVVVAAAIKCAYDTQLVSKGAADEGK